MSLKISQSNSELITQTWAKNILKSPVLYPDERLVSFLKRSFPSLSLNKEKKAIDIGFGSGRHLKLLKEFGFDAYGIDVLEEAKILTRDSFNFISNDHLFVGDYRNFTFNSKFDLAILWGALFLTPYSKITNDLKLILNLLNDGGRIILNMRSKENWFYKLGEKIEDNTYLLDKRANEYSGYLYSFVDKKDLEDIFPKAGLEILHIEKIDIWKNNLEHQHSWYICELRKQ